jgi:hypothetical protein
MQALARYYGSPGQLDGAAWISSLRRFLCQREVTPLRRLVCRSSRLTQAAHSFSHGNLFALAVDWIAALFADDPEIVFPMPFAAAEFMPGQMAFSAGSAKPF